MTVDAKHKHMIDLNCNLSLLAILTQKFHGYWQLRLSLSPYLIYCNFSLILHDFITNVILLKEKKSKYFLWQPLFSTNFLFLYCGTKNFNMLIPTVTKVGWWTLMASRLKTKILDFYLYNK